MKSLLLFTVFSLAWAAPSYAVNDPLIEKLEAIRVDKKLPGLMAAQFKNSLKLNAAAVGVRKMGEAAPLEVNDKFHIGSLTKSMTAFLASMSIEESKLNWSSSLGELFPEIEVHPQLKNVTLELLLVHRSGLPRGLGMYEQELDEAFKGVDESKLSITELRALILGVVLKKAPEFAPTSKYEYSNVGYVMVGHILERLHGKAWETLLIEKLLRPLNMRSCGFGFPANIAATIPDQPWGHEIDEKGNIKPTPFDNLEFWGPAGRVHCTLEDLNKYYSMQIDGFNGVDSLIKAASFTKLHTAYPGGTYTYGGWIRLERSWAKGPAFTHSGTNEKNMAYVWLAPKTNSMYFGFSNIGGKAAAEGIDGAIGLLLTLEKSKK
jgi:CubicO group peptidase (beta-lactamase class C family)